MKVRCWLTLPQISSVNYSPDLSFVRIYLSDNDDFISVKESYEEVKAVLSFQISPQSSYELKWKYDSEYRYYCTTNSPVEFTIKALEIFSTSYIVQYKLQIKDSYQSWILSTLEDCKALAQHITQSS